VLIAFSSDKFEISKISNHAGITVPKLILTGILAAVNKTTLAFYKIKVCFE